MNDVKNLLLIAKQAVKEAISALHDSELNNLYKDHSFDINFPKEMKSGIDRYLEKLLLAHLQPTEIPILSEERGEIAGTRRGGMLWIIDPLDGTSNFIRSLGPSAVSIALFCYDMPIFGVIGEYPSGKISWGGKTLGSFTENLRLVVSTVSNYEQAILCSGFPSRFDMSGDKLLAFIELIKRFGKVRMFGSAAISLLKVANGSAEAYCERQIMIWDIASGIAIIEGAGGKVLVRPGDIQHSCNVFGSNGKVEENSGYY
jgi:myo-inositol-1(or 4)-monophosphatase